jgi:hypothetical protein
VENLLAGSAAAAWQKDWASPDSRGRLSPHKPFAPATKKAAPLLGPRFKEVKIGGLSGKAMQVAAPRTGTVLREMLTGKESEGHCFGFAASLLH